MFILDRIIFYWMDSPIPFGISLKPLASDIVGDVISIISKGFEYP